MTIMAAAQEVEGATVAGGEVVVAAGAVEFVAASASGVQRDPYVVAIPAVPIRSLTSSVRPLSGPSRPSQ